MNRTAAIRDFFEAYASVSMGPEPARHAEFYADEFIAAGPSGSAVYRNDDRFLEWLSQVRDFNEQTGMDSVRVLSIRDIPISDHYAIATVEWGVTFRKTGEDLIRFEITYLLQFFDDKPGIMAYIDHEDQETVMKERGID